MESLMKRLLAGALACLVGTAAHATLFTLESYSVDQRDVDPGLVLYVNDILTTPAYGNIAVGESATFALFELGTNECCINLFEDTNWYDIFVDFTCSSPDNVVGTASGRTRGRLVFDDGVVRWDDPVIFSYGDGGQFSIGLIDAAFGTPGSTPVYARLQNIAAPIASIPEPGSVSLFGAALILLGWRMRSRQA